MVTENARFRKVAGVRFFARFAENLRKSAGIFLPFRLVFAALNP